MNKKTIQAPNKIGKKKNCRWSIAPRPFLQNKVCEFLKADSKKIAKGQSEFDGKLSPYIIAIITADLKARKILT